MVSERKGLGRDAGRSLNDGAFGRAGLSEGKQLHRAKPQSQRNPCDADQGTVPAVRALPGVERRSSRRYQSEVMHRRAKTLSDRRLVLPTFRTSNG
jgi:hypothetical protein